LADSGQHQAVAVGVNRGGKKEGRVPEFAVWLEIGTAILERRLANGDGVR
jgi:hypothetical protein